MASSEELKGDREQFEIFIARQNQKYVKEHIFFEFIIWENFLDAVSHTRLQDEYNKQVANCDIFVSLFKTKVEKAEYIKILRPAPSTTAKASLTVKSEHF